MSAQIKIGPKDKVEEEIFVTENFRADLQHAIYVVMRALGINRKELAKRLECSQANISQILSDEGNPTIETIARIFHALGDVPHISSEIFQQVQEEREDKNLESATVGAEIPVFPHDVSTKEWVLQNWIDKRFASTASWQNWTAGNVLSLELRRTERNLNVEDIIFVLQSDEGSLQFDSPVHRSSNWKFSSIAKRGAGR